MQADQRLHGCASASHARRALARDAAAPAAGRAATSSIQPCARRVHNTPLLCAATPYRIGTEHEKFGFQRGSHARMTYPQIEKVMRSLVSRCVCTGM